MDLSSVAALTLVCSFLYENSTFIWTHGLSNQKGNQVKSSEKMHSAQIKSMNSSYFNLNFLTGIKISAPLPVPRALIIDLSRNRKKYLEELTRKRKKESMTFTLGINIQKLIFYNFE